MDLLGKISKTKKNMKKAIRKLIHLLFFERYDIFIIIVLIFIVASCLEMMYGPAVSNQFLQKLIGGGTESLYLVPASFFFLGAFFSKYEKMDIKKKKQWFQYSFYCFIFNYLSVILMFMQCYIQFNKKTGHLEPRKSIHIGVLLLIIGYCCIKFKDDRDYYKKSSLEHKESHSC